MRDCGPVPMTNDQPAAALSAADNCLSVRNTVARDFDGITELCRRIYPDTPPWNAEQLESHLHLFPEGQFVAVYGPEERVVGMCASLIVDWEDYNLLDDGER